MRLTLIFLLITFTATAQFNVSTTPKVIYKATGNDTVVCTFTPTGTATLTLKAENDLIDNAREITGQRVLKFALENEDEIRASGTGTIAYTVYKNGINVTPAQQPDSSLINMKALLQTTVGKALNVLSAADKEALLGFLLWERGVLNDKLKVKKVNKFLKN